MIPKALKTSHNSIWPNVLFALRSSICHSIINFGEKLFLNTLRTRGLRLRELRMQRFYLTFCDNLHASPLLY